MRKFIKVVLFLVFAGLALIQFVAVDRSNPPVTGEVEASSQVMEVLRSSCYDCHSNETRWPWYSRVAPVSWRIAQHVEKGREHINFSEWQGLPSEDLEEFCKYVAEYKNGKAKVGLKEIPIGHPFYNLEGKDNIVMFYTERYSEQPMIIKGAGAGADVTASGLFADIIRIGNN